VDSICNQRSRKPLILFAHREVPPPEAIRRQSLRLAVILAALLVLASSATAKDPKDRSWVALTRVQCDGVSVVIWREVDDPTDYYGTTEHAWNDASGGRFPRVQGFAYNDDTGEASLNGKKCTGVPEELRGIKIRQRQGG
jgi:hypothetical protein